MSARIEASYDELRKAARTHRLEANTLTSRTTANSSRSAVLLRFYGVESGMKANFIKMNRLSTTIEIPEGTFGANGHDLQAGAKALRVSAAALPRPPRLRCASKRGEPVPIARSHEALRYGVDLDKGHRDNLDNWLIQALNWLQEEGVA